MQSNSKPSIWRTFTERRPLLMTVAVLAWSTRYFVILGLGHSNGPELYGVLTAALSIGAAVASLALLRSPRPQPVATAAVLILWAVVALGGIAGTIAHVAGPIPGHGPIDLRPRPIAAPLAFTLLGSVGALALFVGQRARTRRGTES